MILSTTLEAKSPISVTLRRGAGFSISSQSYLPGPVVRGAIAWAYLERGGQASHPAFQRIFVGEGARFLDHRIEGAPPWPASVRRCAECEYLLDLLVAQWRRQSLLPKCPNCGAKTERPNPGFYRGPISIDANHPQPFEPENLRMERRMHTAIDARTLKVAPKQFHSSRVLSADQRFKGAIACPDDHWPDLTTILDRLGKSPLTIGRGRTRGQGTVELKRGAIPSGVSLPDRLSQFQRTANNSEKLAFSVTMNSATLILDPWLASKSQIEGADLHPSLAQYTQVAAFTSQTEWSGWHGAANLPKADTTVIAPGSCYVFARTIDPSALDHEMSQLAETLQTLELEGVGERLAEGFGEAQFCAPIHYELC